MNRVRFACGAIFTFALLAGCSDQMLPLGVPSKHVGYSNAVILGAASRDPLTGSYVVAANGQPIPVTVFNDKHEALSDTIEEDRLAYLIGVQGAVIAQQDKEIKELEATVVESIPRDITLSDERAERLYPGQTHGIPW